MEAIANLVISAFDLVEAEGRTAHRAVIRLCTRMLAVLIGGILGAVGALLMAWGLFHAIALAIGGSWGNVWAAFICGGVLLGGATGAFLFGRRAPKRPEQSRVDSKPFEPRNRQGETNDGPIHTANAA